MDRDDGETVKGSTYFLSFVEEAIQNPKWFGYVGGRVEVYEAGVDKDAIEEIRFLTKKLSAYHKLRDRYDFEDIAAKGLKRLRKKLSALGEKE